MDVIGKSMYGNEPLQILYYLSKFNDVFMIRSISTADIHACSGRLTLLRNPVKAGKLDL